MLGCIDEAEQSPRAPLEAIIADADLDVLGRIAFPVRNQRLRRKLDEFGSSVSDGEWYAQQIAFLKEHRYFTPTARRLHDAQKARSLKYLVERSEPRLVKPDRVTPEHLQARAVARKVFSLGGKR